MQWHLDASSLLTTIKMGWKLVASALPLPGGAGSPSNTMWPGPRPTCMPSFILIHPTVWPQHQRYRQDRQDKGPTACALMSWGCRLQGDASACLLLCKQRYSNFSDLCRLPLRVRYNTVLTPTQKVLLLHSAKSAITYGASIKYICHTHRKA